MRLRRLAIILAAFQAAARLASGVILVDSGDPTTNTSPPGDNSGWQYEGQFGGFLGTPIAPLYFVTAKHIGGQVGMAFTFHGETFTTTAVYPDPDTDLQIWQVDHAFADYAPLYTQTGSEPGLELRVIGRGTQRGADLTFDGNLCGWDWGPGDGVQRWGRNLVTAIVPYGTNTDWLFLQANFDSPGLPSEAHLSAGDSGGGVFILQNGLWCLAGINYGVDDLFTAPDPSTEFVAAVFDARGYYEENDDGSFTLITGGENVPTAFYCTQVSARLAWIQSVTGSDPTVLPSESFSDWQTLYFTPDQLADATVSGPGADPDGDGIPNLLEFAFNLDPTCPQPVLMTAGTGLCGLPLIQLSPAGASGQSLTVEFVRRTAASGSGVTYAVQFTPGLDPATVDWEAGGTESVTPINARWERVLVTDTVTVGAGASARFARVAVTQPPAAAAASQTARRRTTVRK